MGESPARFLGVVPARSAQYNGSNTGNYSQGGPWGSDNYSNGLVGAIGAGSDVMNHVDAQGNEHF